VMCLWARREHRLSFCARVAPEAPARGPSTSPFREPLKYLLDLMHHRDRGG
jgi:hypothetical protein